MSETGKVSLPTPERLEAIKTAIIDGVAVYPKSTVVELMAALEEAQRQVRIKSEEIEIRKGNVKVVTADLVEAQQSIGILQSENKRQSSLLPVLKDATELMSWRDPGNGKGQKGALSLIYKWLDENPSPEYLAALGNKEGSDKV